ncbi:hypothetical protein [Frondihabitans australicus]|uniref:DUF2470 domain-containing protein n=1 Tax=Frondihabitans australicus TaxID=386892 RepID=A0A495IMH4_9MICO|nr:hypothetical protein [Frondihabitans australicus]RKR76366.1 hypothetical protein C8E83_3538 [Frondihabitans australicus]
MAANAAQNGAIMPDKTLFAFDAHNRVDVAVITDDLHVTIGPHDTVTIHGWEGTTVSLDFDDTCDMVAVLADAVTILRDRGHRPAERPTNP